MKENKYDDSVFFQKYSEMSRSKYGLQGAGEWQEFQKMMPDFSDKEVLDLGCGVSPLTGDRRDRYPSAGA